MKLEGFEGRVEVGGRKHVVKVIDGNAELEKSESGKLPLRIRITAEVDGVKSEYTMTLVGVAKTTRPWDAPQLGPTPPAAERQTPRGSPP